MDGLNGTFCRDCSEEMYYYVRASTGAPAHCEPCSEVSSSQSVIVLIMGLSCAVAATFAYVVFTGLPEDIRRPLTSLYEITTNAHLCARLAF